MLRHFFPTLAEYRNHAYWGLAYFALALCGYLIYRRLSEVQDNRRQAAFLGFFCAVTAAPLGHLSSRVVAVLYEEEWSLGVWLEGMVSGGTHTYHAAMIAPLLTWAFVIKRFTTLDFWQAADAIMLHFPLGHALGRVGCLIAGCCFGEHVDWHLGGFHYDYKNPVPLYAVIGNVIMFAWLTRTFYRVHGKPGRPQRAGLVVAGYFMAYAVMRFVLEAMRTEPKLLLGLTQAQLFMVAFFIFGLRLRKRILDRPVGASDADGAPEPEPA